MFMKVSTCAIAIAEKAFFTSCLITQLQAPAASGGGGMMGGLMGTMVQGMAFGTGSAVANRAVDSVMGPRQVEHVHNGAEGAAAPAVAAGAAPAGGNMAGKCMDEKEW